MRRRAASVLGGMAFLASIAAVNAYATLVNNLGGGNGSESNMQEILDGITYGGDSSLDAYTDYIPDGSDAYWTTGGVGISSATMIVEIAGLAGTNSFGIYDASNVNNFGVLFKGNAAAGHKVGLTFGDYGTNGNLLILDFTTPGFPTYATFNSATFGFFLNNGTTNFYSDTTKNTDQLDHMVAYGKKGNDFVLLPGNPGPTPWLQNEYVLAFEHTLGGGDHDYNDMVLMVESVAPTPEPGTIVLLGAGLLGLGMFGRKRMKA